MLRSAGSAVTHTSKEVHVKGLLRYLWVVWFCFIHTLRRTSDVLVAKRSSPCLLWPSVEAIFNRSWGSYFTALMALSAKMKCNGCNSLPLKKIQSAWNDFLGSSRFKNLQLTSNVNPNLYELNSNRYTFENNAHYFRDSGALSSAVQYTLQASDGC